MQVCLDILSHFKTKPDLLGRVITGDESWIFNYNPETKCQSLQRKRPLLPRLRKAQQSVMLSTFFNVKGIVHYKFLSQGQTISVSTERYCRVCLIQCTRRGKICIKKNHDCFTLTMCLLTMPWASDSSWLRRTLLCWSNLPIYPTWLCGIIFSPKLKGIIKETHFEDVNDKKGYQDETYTDPRRTPSGVYASIAEKGGKGRL